METNIKIGSSSGDEIYTVSFKIDNGIISINCNCRAGLVKTICKHRLNLLGGDLSAMVDKNEKIALANILTKIANTKILDLYKDLNKAEREFKKVEAAKKKLRKEIGLKFSNGC